MVCPRTRCRRTLRSTASILPEASRRGAPRFGPGLPRTARADARNPTGRCPGPRRDCIPGPRGDCIPGPRGDCIPGPREPASLVWLIAVYIMGIAAEKTSRACAGRTGTVSNVKVVNEQGVANQVGPESCAGGGNSVGEALIGGGIGRVLSREKRGNFGALTWREVGAPSRCAHGEATADGAISRAPSNSGFPGPPVPGEAQASVRPRGRGSARGPRPARPPRPRRARPPPSQGPGRPRAGC